MTGLMWGRGVVWSLGLLLAGLVGAAPRALGNADEAKQDRPAVDASRVYFGKAACCKSPAVVDADRVFRSIAEYKTILQEKLTETDARYSLLLQKASRKFRAAVEGAAGDGGYDLVAEVGAVQWDGHDVPDVTEEVLRKAEEAEKAK